MRSFLNLYPCSSVDNYLPYYTPLVGVFVCVCLSVRVPDMFANTRINTDTQRPPSVVVFSVGGYTVLCGWAVWGWCTLYARARNEVKGHAIYLWWFVRLYYTLLRTHMYKGSSAEGDELDDG